MSDDFLILQAPDNTLATEAKQDEIISALGGSTTEALILKTDSNDENITYIGTAQIGSETDQAVWRIKRLDETNGLVVKWADGNDNYDNIFDDRESLTYK